MTLQVYCIWGLTFLAALLTIALRNLPARRPKHVQNTSSPDTPLLSRPAEELSAPHAVVWALSFQYPKYDFRIDYLTLVTLKKPHVLSNLAYGWQVKRMLHYHLPPRGFWSWWCGGMAVYDALVVVAWVIVNILYVQQRVSLILPIFKRAPTPLLSSVCLGLPFALCDHIRSLDCLRRMLTSSCNRPTHCGVYSAEAIAQGLLPDWSTTQALLAL